MSNFYTDNSDLQFAFRHIDWSEIISMKEHNYSEADQFSDAPSSFDEAMMNYESILELAGEVSGEYINPRSAAVDEQGCKLEKGVVHYAPETDESLKDLTHAGLMGIPLPRKYGGLNCSTVIGNTVIEIVSRADAGLMTIFGLQEIAETINMFANDEQKDATLPRFARGDVTGAMVLTEPDAGSDLQAVQLRANENPDDDIFLLNGVKRFISNGCGEILLVLARSEPKRKGAAGLSMFLCEKGPTVKIRRLENKLGIKGSPTCEMQFMDTPAELVGKRRRGLTHYVMSLMNGARIAIAAQATGIAEAAYRAAVDYSKTREQFGKSIIKFTSVADMLVEMKTMVEASRALNMETCYAIDIDKLLEEKLDKEGLEGDELKAVKTRRATYKRFAAMLTPMSKMYATEICQKVTHDSIQVHGGSGYMKDYPVERYYRDARITNIYEGTTQLQVVAAIGGITSGTFMAYLKVLDGHMTDSVDQSLLKSVRDRVAKTEEVIAFFNEKEQEYRDLYARDMVDLTIELVLSYLLLRQSINNDRKKIVANHFIIKTVLVMDMRMERIKSGETATIDSFEEIVVE